MHVLMTADTVGGVWNYALELTRALAPHGGRVSLATMGRRPSPAQREAAAALSNLHLHESTFALEWMEEPWSDVQRAGEWLLELERELRPDVVQVNGYVHAALPFRAPVISVSHSCVLSWWRAVRGEPAPPSWDRYQQKVRDGLAAAALVVAPSRSMLASLEREYGPQRHARVISNGRSLPAGDMDARGQLVLSAGRLWDESKNLGAMDAVAPRLKWPVYIAGDGTGPDGGVTTLQHARALGTLAPVDLGCWMRRAAIYALPAHYEPFGLSVLEAALSGCALVLSDIPTFRELWDGVAVFVDSRTRASLHRGIDGLIRDPAVRRRLAAAAMERAQTLTPARMAFGYLRAYETVMLQRHALTAATQPQPKELAWTS